ncbi:MAG: HAMP domain-containing protein, partial [Rhodospirillales bacterium]|nr:HAMP domain-containing protein [Rhodospirillales bacterium]
VSMLIIFTFFCGVYLYFLIDDCVACLRAELFRRHGIAFRPGRGRVLHKFFVAFFAVGVLPGSLAFLEPWIFADIRPLQGISVTQAYLFDLVIAMLMAGTAFYFIQRNLARPLDMLLQSVRRVATGDLKTRSPVLTNDEFGTLACNFNQMVEGLGEREFLRETFGRYVPEEIAEEILANRGYLAPQRRAASVLYSDIAGFTTICEGIAPEAVVTMLNDYFSALVEVIHRNGGVVTQFQGDAALAVFNVPVANPDHASDAIRAALEIEAVTASSRFGDGHELPTRIGVNTGTVVAGPVGAGDRLNYTIHGDAVNTAARLEQLNKEYGTFVLVSAETREAAGDGFDYTRLGETRIRGKTEPTTVYSVSAEKGGHSG